MCPGQDFIRMTLDDAIQASLSQWRSQAFVAIPKAAHQEWQQKCHEQAEAKRKAYLTVH